jgi:PAS domain S-box-containing protein
MRKAANTPFDHELETFHALYDLATAMTAERSLDENLSLVVETVRRLLNVDACFTALRDDEAGEVYMRAHSGIKTEAFARMRIPLGIGLGGTVAASGQGRIIADYFSEVDPYLHDLVRAEGFVSAMAVPMRIGARVLGVLYAANRKKTRFSPEQLNTLCLPANLAAVMIDYTEVVEELRRSRRELERRVEERTAELAAANEALRLENTERRRVEVTLKDQLLFLQTLMDTIPSPIYYKTVEGRYLGCNRAYEAHRGVSREALVGKTVMDTAPPELARKRLEKDLELFRNPGTQVYEDTDQDAHGRRGNYIFNKATFLNADGRLAGLVGVITDISLLKKAQSDLRAGEERFRAVFETAQDCIFIKGPDLRYSHVNPAMLKWLELPLEAVLGKTDEEIFGPAQAKQFRDVDLRVLAGQVIEEQHSITRGPHRIVFDCIRAPLKDAGKKTVGLCGIARDITELSERVLEAEGTRYECKSRAMRATLAKARLAARSESIILLLGESGSGKDFLARYIHERSQRAGGPFFTINCAALPPELAESELFGHEPGAFTGAQGRKRGLLELAEGGTLLLNEIGELSPHLQAKLLTFLDTQSFTRVGGEKSVTVNARLIAATNRDLEKEVKAGRFRQDLFFRLDVFAVQIPPLRKRPDDLPVLVASILSELAKKMGLEGPPAIETAAIQALSAYHWPGNVRELRNVLERALILCGKGKIRPVDLVLNAKLKPVDDKGDWSLTLRFPANESLNEVTNHVKRLMVIEALRRSGGKRTVAARLLGLTPDSLKHYMKTFDLYEREIEDSAEQPAEEPETAQG